MFLSEDEIRQLTGYKQRTKQMRWLSTEGFEFRIRADGSIALLRKHVESLMGEGAQGPPSQSRRPPKRAQPNFSIFER